MTDVLRVTGAHIEAEYNRQHDLERTRLQSVALRICSAEHRLTKAWTAGELTDTDFHAEAMKRRAEIARHYPGAQFQLGDSVRFEQKPCHVYGYIRDVDVWKGKQFLYTVAFIDGDTRRINEAFLHRWHTTPIE